MLRSLAVLALGGCQLVFGQISDDPPADVAENLDAFEPPAPACSQASRLSDEFTAVLANWSAFPLQSVSIDADRLRLDLPAPNTIAALTSLFHYDLEQSSFAADVQLSTTPLTVGDGVRFRLLASTSRSTSERDGVEFAILATATTPNLVAGIIESTDQPSVVKQTSYDPVNQRWLRISQSGSQVTWETSADNATYTVFATRDTTYRYYAPHFEGFRAPTSATRFDVLVDAINPGVPTGLVCPAGVFYEHFNSPEIDDRWALVDEDQNCGLRQRDGELQADLSTGSFDCRIRSSVLYDLRNSTTTLEVIDVGTEPTHRTFFGVELQSKTRLRLEVGDGMLRAIEVNNPTPFGEVPFDLPQQRFWRLTANADGELLFQASPDGLEFATVGMTAAFAGEIGTARLELGVHGSSTGSAQIRFAAVRP